VGVVQVDVVAAQPAQGVLGRRANVVRAQAGPPVPQADLGGDHHVVSPAALGQPPPDDGFRLITGFAGRAGHVDISGIDEVPARRGVGIEDLNGGSLVRGPTEDVATQTDREHVQVGHRQFHHVHHVPPTTAL
jgi:hypothetical protein